MQCSFVCCNIFSSPFFPQWLFSLRLCWSAFVFVICYNQNKHWEHLRFSFSYFFRVLFADLLLHFVFSNIFYLHLLSIRFVHNSNCTLYSVQAHWTHTHTRNTEYNLVFRYHQQLNSSWMPFTIIFSLDGFFYVLGPFSILFLLFFCSTILSPVHFSTILLFHFGFL